MEHQDISFNDESISTLNDDWNYIDESGKSNIINLPAKVNPQIKSFTINRQLPNSIPLNTVLVMRSSHKAMQVYLDNVPFYTYSEGKKNLVDLYSGGMWTIIRLPYYASGRTLTIHMENEHNSVMELINDIYIGSKSSFLLYILHTRGLSLLVSLIFLIIGLGVSVSYFVFRKFTNSSKSILYLGLFAVIISFWMIVESDLLQFFMNNRYFISTIKYFSLITCPIPLLLYLYTVESYRYRKLMLYLSYLASINALLLITLQVFNITNLHDGLTILDVFFVIIFFIVFYSLCRDVLKHKNKDLLYLTVAFFILILFSTFEIIYYLINLSKNRGSFLQLGLSIFMIILLWRAVSKAMEIIKLSQEAKYYEYLATRDYMTKCKNRTAYSKELDTLSLDREVAVIMADANNMKHINDTYGHMAGDEVLIKCSQALYNIFGDADQCYRIGGDEFVCLQYNKDKVIIENMIEEFLKEIMNSKENHPYDFVISIGYAIYDKNLDRDIFDTVKRADKNMYERKAILKG